MVLSKLLIKKMRIMQTYLALRPFSSTSTDHSGPTLYLHKHVVVHTYMKNDNGAYHFINLEDLLEYVTSLHQENIHYTFYIITPLDRIVTTTEKERSERQILEVGLEALLSNISSFKWCTSLRDSLKNYKEKNIHRYLHSHILSPAAVKILKNPSQIFHFIQIELKASNMINDKAPANNMKLLRTNSGGILSIPKDASFYNGDYTSLIALYDSFPKKTVNKTTKSTKKNKNVEPLLDKTSTKLN